MGKLDGRVAFVTGVARNQGRSHALTLAEEGADIIGLDICREIATSCHTGATEDDLAETVKLVEELGRGIVVSVGDVRKYADVEAAFQKGLDEFGRCDIVLANAGIFASGKFWEIELDAWQEMIDINLTGFWNTIAATVPAMIEAGNGGSIIATSSAAGLKAVPGAGHYCASKFGVVGLTNSLAIELGEYNIRVNSIHTYGVDTALGNDVSMYATFEKHPTYVYSFSPGALPTDSLTPPEQVSEVVLFLASDASALMTGAQVVADKGYLKI